MKNYICTTCGTQFAQSKAEPDYCPICNEERQYVNPSGQQWTTLSRLKQNLKIVFQKEEVNLYGIGITPEFGIGQRALLLQTQEGTVLWDCITFIDEATIDFIQASGGVDAIAISHPHYYSCMVEWSQAFGDIPIYLHEKDRQWVQRPHKNIHYWQGVSQHLFGGLTLYNTGGHFEGGTILYWPEGAGGRGVLLTGDILQVVADMKHVSFMYSYPNLIPLNANAVNKIIEIVKPLKYDRIYGAWWNRNITENANKAVENSARRYLQAIR